MLGTWETISRIICTSWLKCTSFFFYSMLSAACQLHINLLPCAFHHFDEHHGVSHNLQLECLVNNWYWRNNEETNVRPLLYNPNDIDAFSVVVFKSIKVRSKNVTLHLGCWPKHDNFMASTPENGFSVLTVCSCPTVGTFSSVHPQALLCIQT